MTRLLQMERILKTAESFINGGADMTQRRQEISDNIKAVRERIAQAAEKAGKRPEDITLVGVTKNFGVEDMQAALDSGIEIVGENRVQELLDKYDRVRPQQWHMIGHLQTNKVKYIVGKVSLIQSVDSVHLLEEIEHQAEKKNVIADILLQVNTSGEQTKFGASVDEIWGLIEKVQTLSHIRVRGLMTIAPLYVSGVSNRLHFCNTQKLYIDIKEKKYDNISMDYLSMGMSGDFCEAILCGSNMVRVGSAIFGKRNYT